MPYSLSTFISRTLIHVPFAGASGYRGGFPRGGQRGAPRGQSARGRSSGRSHEPLKFDEEYDFESANAQFDKDEIERELKEKLTLGNSELLISGRILLLKNNYYCWGKTYVVTASELPYQHCSCI